MGDGMLKEKYKRNNTIIVFAIVFFLLGRVIFGMIFPTFHFEYKKGMKDGNIRFRDIAGGQYMQLKLRGGYPFSQIRTIIIGDNLDNSGNILEDVYQNELGLYADSDPIKSLTELKKILRFADDVSVSNGLLVSNGDAVYFIYKGAYRAFANAEVFDFLGFDWNKINKISSSELAKLKKEKNITLNSNFYLPGTFVKIGGEIYLIGEQTKQRIDSKDAQKFVKDYYSIIEVNPASLESVGKMVCHNNKKQQKCFFGVREKSVLPNAEVLIKVNEQSKIEKVNAIIKTFGSSYKTVAKITLENMKKFINLRYKDEILFIKQLF